eukprot:3583675-Rhodomonas_salina.1
MSGTVTATTMAIAILKQQRGRLNLEASGRLILSSPLESPAIEVGRAIYRWEQEQGPNQTNGVMVRVRIATACLLLVNINVINAVTHAVTPSMTGPQVSGVFSAVSDGDVIEFAAGMYNTACGLNVSSAQVTIAGAGSLQTVLNCTEAESRHFEISGMGVVLRDLHLTGGFSQCVPSSPTCGD